MLTVTSAKFALVEELFKYKEENFKLKLFPGYTLDQWGIKAHNRPWIDAVGNFRPKEKIIEVGGAYSTLPEYLMDKYQLEAWVGDDFGIKTREKLWSRWGNPKEHARKHTSVKYVFEPFGDFSSQYPDNYFDCIFSVSTLEHISHNKIVDVFKDMNRCTKKNGRQLHTIDINTLTVFDSFKQLINNNSQIKMWEKIIWKSGIRIGTKFPSVLELLDRRILVESPDVVFRFYPPNNAAKSYGPNASLLITIEDV